MNLKNNGNSSNNKNHSILLNSKAKSNIFSILTSDMQDNFESIPNRNTKRKANKKV